MPTLTAGWALQVSHLNPDLFSVLCGWLFFMNVARPSIQYTNYITPSAISPTGDSVRVAARQRCFVRELLPVPIIPQTSGAVLGVLHRNELFVRMPTAVTIKTYQSDPFTLRSPHCSIPWWFWHGVRVSRDDTPRTSSSPPCVILFSDMYPTDALEAAFADAAMDAVTDMHFLLRATFLEPCAAKTVSEMHASTPLLSAVHSHSPCVRLLRHVPETLRACRVRYRSCRA